MRESGLEPSPHGLIEANRVVGSARLGLLQVVDPSVGVGGGRGEGGDSCRGDLAEDSFGLEAEAEPAQSTLAQIRCAATGEVVCRAGVGEVPTLSSWLQGNVVNLEGSTWGCAATRCGFDPVGRDTEAREEDQAV